MAHRHLRYGRSRHRACGDDLALQLCIVSPATGRDGIWHGVHLTDLVDAILAPADGLFKVFVDDVEIAAVDQLVNLHGTPTVLFLRLVPLAGG